MLRILINNEHLIICPTTQLHIHDPSSKLGVQVVVCTNAGILAIILHHI